MSGRVRIVIAFVCGLAAAGCVLFYTASIQAQVGSERRAALERYGGETTYVWVSTKQISAGETFSERNVELVEWLVDLLPEGACTQDDDVIGQASAYTVAQNSVLCRLHLASATSELHVPQGMVAVSVSCSAETAVGGYLAAGQTVQAYVVTDGKAQLVCRDVQVLQTSAQGSLSSLSWVILAVEPDVVEALIACASTQKLYFVLPADDVSAGDVPTDDAPGDAVIADDVHDEEQEEQA